MMRLKIFCSFRVEYLCGLFHEERLYCDFNSSDTSYAPVLSILALGRIIMDDHDWDFSLAPRLTH